MNQQGKRIHIKDPGLRQKIFGKGFGETLRKNLSKCLNVGWVTQMSIPNVASFVLVVVDSEDNNV